MKLFTKTKDYLALLEIAILCRGGVIALARLLERLEANEISNFQ